MELQEKLISIARRINEYGASISTEEATKTALILPFIKDVLGYDVFNPAEVAPEFTADIGTKKGEKVDYAILNGGEVQILIECKKLGDSLGFNQASQLFRYFGVTNARVGILTNGRVYKFYTDLDTPNRMDQKPFLELDLLDVDENIVPELKKITKPAFDIESIVSAAGELKYMGQIKRLIEAQFIEPEDEFVRFFASRIYDRPLTQKVREQFTVLTKKALVQFLNDQANDRLKSAITIGGTTQPANAPAPEVFADNDDDDEERGDDIETTPDELEGFQIVRAIIRSTIDVGRIMHRDTKSYFGILVDNNNRKPICRLHFNRPQKYIGFVSNKKEDRYPIEKLDDIFNYSDKLIAFASLYIDQNKT